MTEAPQADIRPSVLFVCTANQIRSPMAAALFGHLLTECNQQYPQWRIESAGTWAKPNMPPQIHAQLIMKRRNLDIGQHRSRSVSRELLQQFRLILTMEKGHKEALQVEFPEIAGRVYLLSEMAGLEKNIPDPIGSQPDTYEKTASSIEEMLRNGCQRIIELATSRMAPANHP